MGARTASTVGADVASGKPVVVEVAMVFILTYLFGPLGILFR
jgi:hypothetical protein